MSWQLFLRCKFIYDEKKNLNLNLKCSNWFANFPISLKFEHFIEILNFLFFFITFFANAWKHLHQTSTNTSTWYCYSKKFAASWIICVLMTNCPEVFASTLNWIPIFWANLTNTCRSEATLLELFMFLTIYGSESNNYSTLMHKTWIRWLKIHWIIWKWPNIIRYFARKQFNICFNDKYFDLESTLFCFVYYSI